jgi:hypothetical protein
MSSELSMSEQKIEPGELQPQMMVDGLQENPLSDDQSLLVKNINFRYKMSVEELPSCVPVLIRTKIAKQMPYLSCKKRLF